MCGAALESLVHHTDCFARLNIVKHWHHAINYLFLMNCSLSSLGGKGCLFRSNSDLAMTG